MQVKDKEAGLRFIKFIIAIPANLKKAFRYKLAF